MFKDIVFLQFSILQDKKALCQKATHSVDWGDLSSAILEQAGRFCTYRMGAPTLTPKFTRGCVYVYLGLSHTHGVCLGVWNRIGVCWREWSRAAVVLLLRYDKQLDGVLILTLIHGHPMVATDAVKLPSFLAPWIRSFGWTKGAGLAGWEKMFGRCFDDMA